MSVLLQVYRTCLEMAYARGYVDVVQRLEEINRIKTQEEFDIMMDTIEDDGWEFSKYDSDVKYRYSRSFSVAHLTEPRRLFVIFEGVNKNSTSLLSRIILGYRKGPERFKMEVVYVHQTSFTNIAKDKFATIETLVNLQTFMDLDLMKNPGSHQQGALRYEKLTKEESETLLSELHVKPQMLPRIMSTDPPIKYFGFQKGDIVRIVRSPNIEGNLCRETYAYRVVV
jgi:DNA-directed RNA polymerase subunit H (RpoH/RPB5)